MPNLGRAITLCSLRLHSLHQAHSAAGVHAAAAIARGSEIEGCGTVTSAGATGRVPAEVGVGGRADRGGLTRAAGGGHIGGIAEGRGFRVIVSYDGD